MKKLMAKKVKKTFTATLELNPEKGGAWLAYVNVTTPAEDLGINSIGNVAESVSDQAAWKNASAAKRWIKAKVQDMTPRKSVKLTPTKFGEKEKPVAFSGVMEFKA